MLSIEEQHIRKLSILNQETWSHHRSGWGFVLSNLYYTLHVNNGIDMEFLLFLLRIGVEVSATMGSLLMG